MSLLKDTAAEDRPGSRGKDSLGCSTAELLVDQAAFSRDMVFRRKTASGNFRNHVQTPASDRGLLIGVSLTNGHHRRVREANRPRNQTFDRGDIYIRDFSSSYEAEFNGSFDFFLIELDKGFLDHAETYTGQVARQDLDRLLGARDDVLENLARALLPALACPDGTDALYLEQMETVIASHLLRRHAHERSDASPVRPLTPPAILRALEMLADRSEGQASMSGIARELNLPRNHFFSAFRNATGVTPYQWLLNQRLENARRLLLRSDLSLADIALSCGFSDQSHFTRIFRRAEGMPPGRWRQRVR
ncbi:AraC family transcriptional regulator [Paracoccus sp. MBLB3053]|uniref:AraC family transcriptional regulator n=1 Tax=Paracoccus aurantius TaxID=3073814 RepID=A0ABU2HV05_9RHOB|nr:AraC family transcriptional regulator [Paracoccus sp. MBLB3053]MDS9468883.1 AraC family transcriptional regulator [Paracoccus sp. MBLB3053]